MPDTREKRTSCIGYGLPFRISLPYADGSLDQGDRQHLVGLYSGILAGAPVVAPVGPFYWDALDVFIPGFSAAGDFAPGLVSAQGFPQQP